MNAASLDLPVQQNERIAVIDMLRGFALFGVLAVNFNMIIWLQTPVVLLAQVTRPIDELLDTLQVTLLLHKFVTLFAMLFGYGFGLLLERVERKGMAVEPFYLRRMGILFVLGMAHAAFWHGEILHTYALAGMILLCYRRVADRYLLPHAAVLILVLPTLAAIAKELAGIHINADRVRELYPLFTSPRLVDLMTAHYTALARYTAAWVELEWLSNTLGHILIGYWCMRKRLFNRLPELLPTVRKVWWYAMSGVAGTGALFLAKQNGLLSSPWVEIAVSPVKSLIILGHALFYAASLILLHAKGYFQQLFKLFSYMGRMSLTNYMTHTVFFLALMYGPGLGLLGKVSYGMGLLFSVCIYAGQALFSWWWLLRFQYGPVEWVWRQLSYGRRFPIRREMISPH